MREHGQVVKKCRDCLKVALVYPSLYRAAVASLAYQTAYYLLNSVEGIVAERFVAERLAGDEPPPRSLETGAPLHSFDLIVVFLSFELDYVNVARMLLAAGIEPLREGRSVDLPPIVVGGPVPGMNPLPALKVADAILVGEVEELLPKLALEAYEIGPRRALEELACGPGFLVEGCGEPVEKVYVRDLDTVFHPVMEFRIPGSGEPWGEAYIVETSRGCPHRCRFCMETRFLHPLRHRSYGRLVDLVERGLEVNGVSRVAFYALSFFDHPDADRLLEKAVYDLKSEVSIGSLRADTLTSDRVELLAEAGQRVLTLAPETVSDRLCRVIDKCIGRDLVEELADEAWRHGMHVKIYLMVGIPGEKDEDVEEAANWLKDLSRRAPPRREALRVTVNPLIPKPWTPMQRVALIDRPVYERRVRMLKRVSSKVLSVEPLSYRYAYAETVIARGDGRIARVIREWAVMGGRLGQLTAAARRVGVNIDVYVSGGVEPAWMKLVKPLPRFF